MSPQGVIVKMTLQNFPESSSYKIFSSIVPSLTLVFTTLYILMFYLMNLVTVDRKKDAKSKKNWANLYQKNKEFLTGR